MYFITAASQYYERRKCTSRYIACTSCSTHVPPMKCQWQHRSIWSIAATRVASKQGRENCTFKPTPLYYIAHQNPSNQLQFVNYCYIFRVSQRGNKTPFWCFLQSNKINYYNNNNKQIVWNINLKWIIVIMLLML